LEQSLVNAAPYDPHIGRVLAGQYRVQALLGRGGMGAVYRGVQLSVDRPVAIKLISAGLPDPAQSLQRFRREAEATGRLNHPNTIRLFDFGLTEQGEVYMVMELLEGWDLAARLQHGPLPPAEAFHIIRQVLSALNESHARGIVHRDLKPGNVFLSQVHGDGDFVKVMDFGIAGMDHGHAAMKLTVTGAVMGTPAYMSPEQAQGKPVDARGDLYACGVVLFEMLAGRTPFEADSLVSMLLAHVTQPPKRLAECGVSFPELARTQALIDRLLAKAPAERPASAAYVIAAIDALQIEGVPAAHSQPRMQPVTHAHTMPAAQTSLPAPAQQALTPLGWDQRSQAPGTRTRNLWIVATAATVATIALTLAWFLPAQSAHKAATTEPTVATKPARPEAPAPNPTTSVQAAITGAAGLNAARTHTEVDTPAAGRGKARDESDTLADVPVAEAAADDDEQAVDEAPTRGSKARSRSSARSAARQRAARLRASRRAAKHDAIEESTEAPRSAYSQAQAAYVPPPAAASDDAMRRAPPFPSMAAAKRAHDSGKISTAAYEAAVSSLKARRTRRIAIEQQNLAQGKINTQEYEWRLGRIDQEYRGD
jgi:eukaryotic-like serine/threonine-protein kinase